MKRPLTAQERLTKLVNSFTKGTIGEAYFLEQLRRQRFTKVNFRMFIYMQAKGAAKRVNV